MYNTYRPPAKEISRSFKLFVKRKLSSIYERHGTIKLQNYKIIEDSDKPGTIEVGRVEVNGTKYKATYWHNSSYSNFEELKE